MTYGYHLAAAAEALARAHAGLKRRPPDAGQRALVALARAGIYRSMERQTVLLNAERMKELPSKDHIPTPAEWHITWHPPATNLAISLRQAPACTLAVRTPQRSSTPTNAVAVALDAADSHLRASFDVLVSNIGPQDLPELQQRPHTTEGMALLAGLGRSDNLALVARLAVAMAELDQRLVRWLWPEDAPRSLQPLLVAAEEDAWRTKSGSLRATAIILAAKGNPDRSPLLDLAVAPPVDDPRRWAQLEWAGDCVTAVDAARSWLLRHGEHITTGQLMTISRATAALVQFAGHIQIHTDESHDIRDKIAQAALAWRGVTQVAAHLRSAVSPSGDHTTATVALTTAAKWLHDQLRTDGDWRQPPPWIGDPSTFAVWRQIACGVLARLPDFADLTAAAVNQSRARDNLLAASDELTQGDYVHRVKWKPAPPDNTYFLKLNRALATTAKTARDLAAVAEVTPRAGLAATATSHATRGDRTAIHLAKLWYTGQPLPNPSKPSKARVPQPPFADPQRRPPGRSV